MLRQLGEHDLPGRRLPTRLFKINSFSRSTTNDLLKTLDAGFLLITCTDCKTFVEKGKLRLPISFLSIRLSWQVMGLPTRDSEELPPYTFRKDKRPSNLERKTESERLFPRLTEELIKGRQTLG
jgi:hypothetical protein